MRRIRILVLVACMLGLPWIAHSQPPLSASASDPRALGWMQGFPPPADKTIRFTDLHQWVMGLEGFSNSPDRSGEKILEAIQMAWIEEVE